MRTGKLHLVQTVKFYVSYQRGHPSLPPEVKQHRKLLIHTIFNFVLVNNLLAV